MKIFFLNSKKTKMNMTNSTAVKVLNQMISNLEIFPILIMLTFTAGIFLNLLSLIIIVNSKRFNPVHLLVSNLLISNMVYLLGIPLFVMNSYNHSWPFGKRGCQIFLFFDFVGMFVSVYTGKDRFFCSFQNQIRITMMNI